MIPGYALTGIVLLLIARRIEQARRRSLEAQKKRPAGVGGHRTGREGG